MAIAFQSITTAVGSTGASAALTIPASVASGDLLIAHATNKPFSAFPTWQTFAPVASIASGSVASGNGLGSVISTHAVRIADSALSGTETATVLGGTTLLGTVSRWTIGAGKMWDLQNSQGADTVETGTAVSATGGTLSVQPNDVIVITLAIKDDVPTHTSQTVTIAGATLSAVTWETKMSTTLGVDCSMYVGRCTVTAGTVTAAPVYAATSSTSGASSTAVVFMRLREIDPALPGFIGYYGDPTVEPESHSHNIPVIDSNGNRYRHAESNLAHDTNRLAIHKSTDGGIVWKAVAWASHPTAQDLECTWIQKVGTKFYVLITRDDTVWLVPFNMSDDASPDTYGTQETVDTGLSSTGVVQYCSFTVLSSGVMHMFYSDTLAGANNQIGHRTRTAVNTYTAKTTFNDGVGQDVTGPAAVLGANDITYVFYKDKTADILYYRTVSADGATISAKTAVASGTAISPQSMPHTNPIYYDDAGVEVIGIAYINDSDILKYRELRNGVLQTEETISTAAVTRNPGTTDSQAVVANLAVDGTTVHAMWSRQADGDLMRDSRTLGGSWGTDTVVWASAGETGWYIYCDVIQEGIQIKLIYTYDQGIHVDDGSNINYNEIVLRTITASVMPSLVTARHR